MDLSVVVPARAEMFLARTVQDILDHSEADTEVIVVLDSEWADPPIKQDERVNVIYVPEPIGQRAACNLAAKLSKAKYILKCDAHCSFAQGFDRIMIEDMQDDWTMVPTMRNLWAFDYKCYYCGWKRYQGPKPVACGQCGKSDKIRMKIVWIAKERPQSNSYRFDQTPHFQYFNQYTKRDEYKQMLAETGLTETMSLQGSCWMLTRDKYWELDVCDEAFGSWGSQGLEVAIKTWLSGGRVMVNHKTYYAHCFRTQAGFAFPYPLSGSQVEHARQRARELFFNGKWDKAVHPLSWLVEKFSPVPGWEKETQNG